MAHYMASAAFDAWLAAEGRDDLHDEVGMGADGTPTIRADQLLEDAIVSVAKSLKVNILSEEAGIIDHGGDYVAVVDARTLEPVAHVRGRVLVAVAARVGPARLIDNFEWEPK